MGGIAADIRAQLHRVTGLRQKPQIRAVGVIHQQQSARLMADLRDPPDIQHVAQIIRAGHIDRRHPLRAAVQRLPYSLW